MAEFGDQISLVFPTLNSSLNRLWMKANAFLEQCSEEVKVRDPGWEIAPLGVVCIVSQPRLTQGAL